VSAVLWTYSRQASAEHYEQCAEFLPLAHYEMDALGEVRTRLNFNVNWMGAKLPAEKKRGTMAGQATNFELFKHVCETNPA
jgi:hypothetical protein